MLVRSAMSKVMAPHRPHGKQHQNPKTINWALGALRRVGKTFDASFRNSQSFRQAAEGIMQLGSGTRIGGEAGLPSEHPPGIERRMLHMRKALVLQHQMESVGIPHQRSLHQMVSHAKVTGRISHEQAANMEGTVQAANAARHRRFCAPGDEAAGAPKSSATSEHNHERKEQAQPCAASPGVAGRELSDGTDESDDDTASFVSCAPCTPGPAAFDLEGEDLAAYERCFFGEALSVEEHIHLFEGEDIVDEEGYAERTSIPGTAKEEKAHLGATNDELTSKNDASEATIGEITTKDRDTDHDRELWRPGWQAKEFACESIQEHGCILEWIDLTDFAGTAQDFRVSEHWWPPLFTVCGWCGRPASGKAWCASCNCWWHQWMRKRSSFDHRLFVA